MTTGQRHRRVPAVVAVIGTAGVCVAAFILSFGALCDLAQRSGVTVPALWPLIVDGFVVVATVAVVAGAGRYAWFLLVSGALVSVAGNVLHAALPDGELPVWLRATVAAVPPIALIATAHLAVVLRRTSIPATETADDKTVGTVPRELEAGSEIPNHEERVTAVDQPVATPEQSHRDTATPPSDDTTKARGMELLAAGTPPREVAEQLGVHRASVYRWRNQIPATA